MNTSFSKRRHLSEANERLEKRFLKSKINEAPEVQPKVDVSNIMSLTQDILKDNGAQFNIGDYVNAGDNPMCVPDNDTTGILSKVFDFFNNLGTTTELESAIGDVLQGQSVGGLQIPEKTLRDQAAIIGAGLLAAVESEGGEVTEQRRRGKGRGRKPNIKRAKCGRTGRRAIDVRDKFNRGDI